MRSLVFWLLISGTSLASFGLVLLTWVCLPKSEKSSKDGEND